MHNEHLRNCALSLRYTADDQRVDAIAPPRFEFEPAGDEELRFTASNLGSVDRLALRWSTRPSMTPDGKNPAAVSLGRRGGKVTSAAKAKAVRANGKLGGRPKGAKDSKPRRRTAK